MNIKHGIITRSLYEVYRLFCRYTVEQYVWHSGKQPAGCSIRRQE